MKKSVITFGKTQYLSLIHIYRVHVKKIIIPFIAASDLQSIESQ